MDLLSSPMCCIVSWQNMGVFCLDVHKNLKMVGYKFKTSIEHTKEAQEKLAHMSKYKLSGQRFWIEKICKLMTMQDDGCATKLAFP